MSYNQSDNKQNLDNRNIQKKHKTEEISGIVVPPGCENKMLWESGEEVSTYVPSSYTPYVQRNNKRIIPHAMNGKTAIVSVPKSGMPCEIKSMTDYLMKFVNANLCIDFWSENHVKIKKCGVLLEVGKDFLVIKENNPLRISLIDLKPIYYINIYCKGMI